MWKSPCPSLPWSTSLPTFSGEMSTEPTSWLIKETNTSPFTAGPAGLLPQLRLWATELKLPVKLNGLMSILLLKFWFHASFPTKDAMEVMPELLTSGFIKTTSLTRLVLLIRLSATIMVWAVMLWLNARTAFPTEDAGLKKELKFIQLINSEMFLVNRTWSTKFTREVPSHALSLLLRILLTTLVVFSKTKPAEKNSIMTLVLSVGEKKMVSNIGLLEILGEPIGVKKETLESSEVLITLVLNPLALGLPPLTPGPRMSETKPNLNLKTFNLENLWSQNQWLAEEILQLIPLRN